MKLMLKQRLPSWLDSTDVFDEAGDAVFHVDGQLSLGQQFDIYDSYGCHIASLRRRRVSVLPRFEIIIGGVGCGDLCRELSLRRTCYRLDHFGWVIEGNLTQWDYEISTVSGTPVARVFGEPDGYGLEVVRSRDALAALLVVLAMDVEKSSRNAQQHH